MMKEKYHWTLEIFSQIIHSKIATLCSNYDLNCLQCSTLTIFPCRLYFRIYPIPIQQVLDFPQSSIHLIKNFIHISQTIIYSSVERDERAYQTAIYFNAVWLFIHEPRKAPLEMGWSSLYLLENRKRNRRRACAFEVFLSLCVARGCRRDSFSFIQVS